MEKNKRKQLTILISLIALIIAGIGGTYAWFSVDRITDTDIISAKTNEDTIDLYVSSQGGTGFTNTNQADIIQVNHSDKDQLMPVSTANLKDFMYASVSTREKLKLARDTKGQYYYQGRIFLKAVATGDHKGQTMTIYLDGSLDSDMLLADKEGLVNASRVGIAVEGKNPVILNFDNEKAPKVASLANGTVEYVPDPSEYVKKYLLTIGDGKATRPEKALMKIELNKEYPMDIYYYMEGFDKDCTEEISCNKATMHLAFFGVLE